MSQKPASKPTRASLLSTSVAQYTKALENIVAAGCGVVITQTREPYRCAEAITELAHKKSRHAWLWDWVNGWTKFNKDDPSKNELDAKVDPVAAAKVIADRGTKAGVGA